MTARTGKLLDLYGAEVLAQAVAAVLARGLHDPGALALRCEEAASRSGQARARRPRARAARARLRRHPARPWRVRPPPERTMTTDIADALRALGLCASREALDALARPRDQEPPVAGRSRRALVRLERRERDARNLASRTKKATLGAMKPLDRFDWSFPRPSTARATSSCSRSTSPRDGHNVLFADPAASARAPSPRTSDSAPSKRASPSASAPSTPRSPTCSSKSRFPPSNGA